MAVFKRNFLKEEHDVITKSEAEEAKSQDRAPRVEKRFWTACELAQESKWIVSSRFCSSDIALVPNSGYLSRDNFSFLSIAWLRWLEKKEGIEIRHASSLDGEYSIPGTNFRWTAIAWKRTLSTNSTVASITAASNVTRIRT